MDVKQKTRDTPGGGRKHSLHVKFSACGVPGVVLKTLCSSVFAPLRSKLREPGFGGFSDEDLRGPDAPCIGMDLQTTGGHTPFAMMLSRKTPDCPYPCLVHRAFYSGGELHAFPRDSGLLNPAPFAPPPVGGQHSLEHLSDDQAVYLLWQASCSVPNRYVATVSSDMRHRAEIQQSRTAASLRGISREPPAAGGAQSSTACRQLPLPKWFRDYLDKTPGYRERPDSARQYALMLPLLKCEGADPDAWLCTHVDKGVPCPTLLSLRSPCFHRHENNGCIVACNVRTPGVVYARCTACLQKDLTNEHCSRVLLQNGNPTPWIKFEEAGFHSLVSDEGKFFVFALFYVLQSRKNKRKNATQVSSKFKSTSQTRSRNPCKRASLRRKPRRVMGLPRSDPRQPAPFDFFFNLILQTFFHSAC